jgi:RNA polymerase sigma-70 factor (ECF subfamily)
MLRVDLPYYINCIAEKNDQQAFSELYKRFLPGLMSFARSIVDDRYQAEEVVENVFLKLWENRALLPTVKNLSHYLYVAVKHASLNQVQRHRVSVTISGVGETFPFHFSPDQDPSIGRENLEKIAAAINSLPPRCRLIFRLIKEESLKYAEVAQLLEVSVKTVEAQMYIALGRIADRLRIELPEFHQYYPSRKKIK